MDIGSAVSRDIGIPQDKIASLASYRTSDLFSETERLVLEYADAMTQTPAEIPAALFERLRSKFEPAQLVELTAALAWENYRARFDHAFGVESENFTEGSFCALPVRSGVDAHARSDI
jgi:alkylhydroperoxidase family enzyme